MTENKMDEKILKEWIEKGMPLVDSAWNLAIDRAIQQVNAAMMYPVEGVSGNFINKANIIKELSKLKKEIK